MMPSLLISVVCLFLFLEVHGADRKITAIHNPECDKCPEETTLIYIRAEGPEDTIHQIWDFTQGSPTIIYAIGLKNSTMHIKWNDAVPKEFVFSTNPKYSFGVIFDSLYEYDDTLDIGLINEKQLHKRLPLDDVKWLLVKATLTDKEVMVELKTKKFRHKDSNEFVHVKFDLLPFTDYATDLPHLIHSANSTLIDFSIVNLTSSYNASRFAWHMILASNDSAVDNFKCDMRKSLDDEHTPGVFEVIEIKTPESIKNQDGGFIQFRPIGYRQKQRGVTSSVNGHVTAFNSSSLPNQSTLSIYFSKSKKEDVLVESMFVSFGESGDGFYKQFNYTSWSLSLGYGVPPSEGFSLFVIVIISIGLGVPIILATSGAVFVLTKRLRQRNLPRRLLINE